MEQLFTYAQVAEQRSCSPVTLWRWIKEGKFPAPIKIGPNTVRFRGSEIEAHDAALERVDYAPSDTDETA